jgi:hypothetical protein
LRLVKEASRKDICKVLNAAGIALLVVSDDGENFLAPFPARFVAVTSGPDLSVYVNDVDLDGANAIGFGADVGRMSLRVGEYVGIVAEYSARNWRSVQAALRRSPASIMLVAPMKAEAFRQYLQVAGLAPEQFVSSLASVCPGLRDWWSSIAPVPQAAPTTERPVEEFRLGLAYALSKNPDALVVAAPAFSELAAEDRVLLCTALRDVKKTVLLWNDSDDPFSEPLPSRVVHIRPEGRQYRSYADPRAKIPRPVRRADNCEIVVLRLPEGDREVRVAGQLGVVVNQPSMSWNEVGHFIRVARKATNLFDRPTTLVAPGLLTNAAAFPLLRRDAAALDLSGLTARYPGLVREWGSLVPYLEALRRSVPNLEALLTDASAATHFWLAMAFALNGEARLVFVRERDFRLIPQNARSRLVASMATKTLVVWKDNLSMPFAAPQPIDVLLTGNARIISVAGPNVLWQELDVETRRAVFGDSFAPPIIDPTIVLAEEGA